MKARKLLDNASGSFGPQAMEIIGRAFDEAWAGIAPKYTGVSAQAARLELATIILTRASDGCRDVEALKDAALKAMKRDAGGYTG